MVDGKTYIGFVKLSFAFLVKEFGFKQNEETENGNVFYDVIYSDVKKTISVSYENIEDCLQVIIFKLRDGVLPIYDDKKNTLHLNELNKIILPEIDKEEIGKNNALFNKFETKNELERKLLKSAKELRLVLRHWDKA